MNANARIQWLHKKLVSKSYPNSHRMAERFHISPRQAQRDLDFLKKKLGAPIAYDKARRGFYYTEPFNLPLLLTSDNDDLYMPGIAAVRNMDELDAAESALKDVDSAQADYYRAVVAARKGKLKEAKKLLDSACEKDPSLREKALKDIEFVAL